MQRRLPLRYRCKTDRCQATIRRAGVPSGSTTENPDDERLQLSRRSPALVEQPSNHRLERGHRLAAVVGVERNFIVERAELSRAIEVRMAVVTLALVRLDPEMAAVEVDLEHRVMLDHPVVRLGHE